MNRLRIFAMLLAVMGGIIALAPIFVRPLFPEGPETEKHLITSLRYHFLSFDRDLMSNDADDLSQNEHFLNAKRDLGKLYRCESDKMLRYPINVVVGLLVSIVGLLLLNRRVGRNRGAE